MTWGIALVLVRIFGVISSASLALAYYFKCKRLTASLKLARDCMREAMRGRDAAQRELINSKLLEDPWCTEYEPSVEIDCDCPGCRAERWAVN